MWNYPSTPSLQNITSTLSLLLTTTPISTFLTTSLPTQTLPVSGQSRIDATAWTLDSQMLVSIVNLEYIGSTANISITLPSAVSGVSEVFYGAETWNVADGGKTIWKVGLEGLEVGLVVFDLL